MVVDSNVSSLILIQSKLDYFFNGWERIEEIWKSAWTPWGLALTLNLRKRITLHFNKKVNGSHVTNIHNDTATFFYPCQRSLSDRAILCVCYCDCTCRVLIYFILIWRRVCANIHLLQFFINFSFRIWWSLFFENSCLFQIRKKLYLWFWSLNCWVLAKSLWSEIS